MAAKFDLYEQVTNRIIASLEAGTPAWQKPWVGGKGGLPLRSNGEPYRGINTIILWLTAVEKGYNSPYWFTYRQAQEKGAFVRKGEKSTTVIKFGFREVLDETTGEEANIPYTKGYAVFNADQIEGLPADFYGKVEGEKVNSDEMNPAVIDFFNKTGAKIRHSDHPRAYYSITEDYIHMPNFESFFTAGGYYATLAHEVTHWTGHESRLNRFNRLSNRSEYAFEELVAEIGNCMLCASLGLTPDFLQSAAYIESWLAALKKDKRFIFKAASEAQKAVDFLREKVGSAQTADVMVA